MRKLLSDAQLQKNVDFEVSEVVFKLGDVKDPVSGEFVSGDQYRTQMAEIAEAYGKNPDGFDYDSAPERGWQEGKRAFTDKVTYNKWHNFKKHKDNYNLVA
jgi:hypothetical protein